MASRHDVHRREPTLQPRIGPFRLLVKLAEGGFGQVWRGEHIRTGTPVAVKLIRPDRAGEELRAQFRHEVCAVARLSHPNIVAIHDVGVVSASTAAAAPDSLTAGSPYLVMDMANAGSLDRVLAAGLAWRHVKRVLTTVLAALSHAHAHAIVHRDVKPQNVLLPHPDDVHPVLRLADFGIAQALADTESATTNADFNGGAVGSALYMSPEQCLGQWRDHGPWTDLYALGVVAWELTTGGPPFEGNSAVALAVQHLNAPLPRFSPRVAVPPGFQGWLDRMVAKSPHDRFSTAREASAALLALGDLDDAASRLPDAALFSELLAATGAGSVGRATDLIATTPILATDLRRPRGTSGTQPAARAGAAPHFGSWRELAYDARSRSEMIDVGLGLFGLRPSPLSAREAERDALWSSLGEVVARRSLRVVVLRGSDGVGRSRLARWIAETAAEAGVAEVMTAAHERGGAPGAGLRKMLASWFRSGGLEGDALRERVIRVTGRMKLADETVAGLVALVDGSCDDATASTSAGFRSALLWRFLQRASGRRPLVVVLDDADRDDATLDFVRYACVRGELEPSDVLLVLTVASTQDGDAFGPRKALDEIERYDRTVRCLDVARMTPAEMRTFLTDSLSLAPSLVPQVRERAGGVPQLAEAWVFDCVERGVLTVGPHGFDLAPGAVLKLPSSVRDLVVAQIQRALERLSPGEAELLRLASLVGDAPLRVELAAACRWLGRPLAVEQTAALVSAGLLGSTPDGWRFASPVVRDVLLREVESAPGATRLHLACAAMVERLYSPHHAAPMVRRGRHLGGAGLRGEAAALLIEGAQAHLQRTELRNAVDAAAEALALLEGLDAGAYVRRRCDALLVMADCYRLMWQFDEAAAWCGRACDEARRAGSDIDLANARVRLCSVERQRGDLDAAALLGAAARDAYAQSGALLGEATALMALAIVARVQGDWESAQTRYTDALQRYETLHDDRGAANCALGLGNLARDRGNLDRAADWYARSRRSFIVLQDRAETANATNGLAEVARASGDRETAKRYYEEALATQQEIGSSNASVTELNLGILEILGGEFSAAQTRLRSVARLAEAYGQRSLLPFCHTFLAAAAAGAGEADALGAALSAAQETIARTKVVDRDIMEMADRAANLAAARGWRAQAAEAAAIATDQRERLGARSS